MGELGVGKIQASVKIQVQRQRWQPFLSNISGAEGEWRRYFTHFASHDVGYAHFVVIHNGGQMVSREGVGLE